MQISNLMEFYFARRSKHTLISYNFARLSQQGKLIFSGVILPCVYRRRALSRNDFTQEFANKIKLYVALHV